MNSNLRSDSGRRVILKDGTLGMVRVIVPEDKDLLADAFEELAEDSRERRFFYNKARLSERELELLSNPDGVDHIAFGLAVEMQGEEEMEPIAVGRCFRDAEEQDLAEIAIVTTDIWQGRGAGAELMRSLSAAASEAGIRRWFAVMFADNLAMTRLLQRFGRKCEERDLGGGIIEAIYEIVEPPGGYFGG